MNIYRSQTGKEKSLALYDRQLLKLNMPFSDIYVKTSFGKTHLVEIGNKTGKPLLVFHGGNATTAYNLLMCIAPSKIDKAVFIVPAGISNAVPVSSMAMLIPLLQYRITKREKYLVKTALYMALREEVLDEDTIAILKDSFDNVKIKAAMPANIEKKR